MITGIKIEFKKEDHNYFENEIDNDIDYNLLIISLLETVNDICKENDLDTNEQLRRYIEFGSVDNYATDEEKELMKKYKHIKKIG